MPDPATSRDRRSARSTGSIWSCLASATAPIAICSRLAAASSAESARIYGLGPEVRTLGVDSQHQNPLDSIRSNQLRRMAAHKRPPRGLVPAVAVVEADDVVPHRDSCRIVPRSDAGGSCRGFRDTANYALALGVAAWRCTGALRIATHAFAASPMFMARLLFGR